MDKNSPNNEYNTDFYKWAMHNAQLLREGKVTEIDLENLAEEIESMGKREKRQLINRLAILIAHLLKWEFQPGRRGNSWKYTIKEQRVQLVKLLKDSPSLKYTLAEYMADAYEDALYKALAETGFDEKIFPKVCLFSLEQILDDDFYPDK